MKFSIRDLFLVTLIVALAVSWWLQYGALARRKEEIRDLRHSLEVSEEKRDKLRFTLGLITDKATAELVETSEQAYVPTVYISPKDRAPAPNPLKE